jgi:hypothetical protein
MSISNETTLLGSTKTYDNGYESYIIRLNDPKEGRLISAQGIKEIVIEENIFSLLPTIRIEIEDQGSYFAGYNIKNGDKIYFIVTPVVANEGEDPTPYVDSVYAVQNVSCVPSLEGSNYQYVIIGIYYAQSYLNEVASYPKTTIDSLLFQNTKRSDEAIQEVLDDTTLKLSKKIEGSDKGLWLNCRKTRAQFIEKIIEHAWIDEDDAPLIYTNLNGESVFTSVKTMAKQKKLCTFTNVKNYIESLQGSSTQREDLEYPFTSVQFLHAAGPILNQGGYKVRANYYTPYNLLSLFDLDISPKDIDVVELLKDLASQGNLDPMAIVDAQVADKKTVGKFREAVYKQDEPYIASRSNKASSQIDRLTKNIDAGIYFKEYHNHYDVAPVHNEMIRRSFFQNFINMTVDVHRLPKEYQTAKCRPVLGDKVNLDFSTADSVDKIHTGNYIVAGISHHFKAFQSYTLDVKCVTDGTYGMGILEQNDEKAKKK